METKLQWKLHGRQWVLSNGLHSGRHVGLEQSESRSGVGSTEVCRYRSLGVCPISSRYQEIPRIQLNNSQEIPTRITQLQCHSMSQHVTACHSILRWVRSCSHPCGHFGVFWIVGLGHPWVVRHVSTTADLDKICDDENWILSHICHSCQDVN